MGAILEVLTDNRITRVETRETLIKVLILEAIQDADNKGLSIKTLMANVEKL